MLVISNRPRATRSADLKGHSHAILVHFKNKKICRPINEHRQIMV